MADRPTFTLLVVTTADALIARHPADSPAAWASPEEQAHFFAQVEAADWSIMGRHTHEAADRPDRRRIVFSTAHAGWRRPTQLWLDPATLTPADLAPLVAGHRPLRQALILGGTRVHDWFLAHRAIDRVLLTVEPVTFGRGLPIFTGQAPGDPVAAFSARGYTLHTDHSLNATGTRLLDLRPT